MQGEALPSFQWDSNCDLVTQLHGVSVWGQTPAGQLSLFSRSDTLCCHTEASPDRAGCGKLRAECHRDAIFC